MRSNYLINCKQKNEKVNQIKAIIFCEFDVKLGPILKYQQPEDYVSKETFESLSVYLIPKSELYGKLITITAFGLKILGYPISISHSKYKRNQLIFNLCFVFSDFSRTTQYEPIIQKLAHYLVDLEWEMEFFSKKGNDLALPCYLSKIREQLNNEKICIISISQSTTIHLKLARVQPEPGHVENYHVPVIIFPECFSNNSLYLWDLTTQQIFPYINGFNHVSKIAIEADVDLNLVKACIQNLIYYGLANLIPIFQYSNVYVTTPKICLLLENVSLQDKCLSFVRKTDSPHVPTLRQVLLLYSNMCPGMTVKDLCQRYNPNLHGIDEQKLIKFGLMNEIIRRIQKFPILLSPATSVKSSNSPTDYPLKQSAPLSANKSLDHYFDGTHSYDQICCERHKTYSELEEKVEQNPSIVVCWK